MDFTYLTLEAPHRGSAGHTHIHEIMKGLEGCGWRVRLYAPSYTNALKAPGLLVRLLASLWLQIRMWAMWRRGSVLYVRGHYLAFPSALIAKMIGVPIFHEINGPYEDVFIAHPALKKFRRILIPMQRIQYRWASGLIAVTEQLCQWATRESGGNSCAFIPNAANTDLFNRHASRPDGLPDFYVIFFGGLSEWHGVPVMLDAILHPDWPNSVHLVVIGEGVCSPILRERAKHDPRIHVLGKVPHEDIPGYVVSAIAGLVPISNPGGRSDTGLFPLKLFETLACGAPVIVTDFPGQADLVRANNCGVVIPADDSAALASAVKLLWQNQNLRASMGQRAEALILSEHNWGCRVRDTDQLIRKVIVARSNPRV